MFALFDAPWSPFYLMLIFFVHKITGIVAAVGTLLIFLLSVLQEKLCQDLIIEANRINFRNLRFEESIFRNSEVCCFYVYGKSSYFKMEEKGK